MASLTKFSFLKSLSSYTNAFRLSSTNLKDVVSKKIVEQQKIIGDFRAKHDNTVIGQITVGQVYGGMRGMIGLICETSNLDPDEGIRFRGHTIPDCIKNLPRTHNAEQPQPEALFWLLMTDEIPTAAQVAAISTEWNERGAVPAHVVEMLNHLPSKVHPMSQFAAAIMAMDSDSKFADAYNKGIHKANYWEYVYEDSMDLIAKLTTVAAIIYRNSYRDATLPAPIDPKKDYSENFTSMLGYTDKQFTELMRLYLLIHSDHEGGNVSAHASNLVSSALSNPYLSFGASMAGLAGPLHGLANQEVLVWTKKLQEQIGDGYTEESLRDFIWKTLKGGQVVPGYGHAVLRVTDPRYVCQREFALKHLPDDKLFKLVSMLYKVVPDVLLEHGKAKNPWPNVDAHSGVLLQYYKMTEMNYYTVLFGVSRALGVLAMQVWARALGFPLERPKSVTSANLIKMLEKK